MGYWVNTTYLNHGSVEDVADAVKALCAAEGMGHIAAPAASWEAFKAATAHK